MADSWKIPVFGVRHLSPTGAWHLRRYLDEISPDVVLIEGLDDAADLIPHMTRKGTKPPIAILAYTDSLPVRTLVYPLARYSPELQAMVWAREHKKPVEFIDLPSDIFLALQDIEEELFRKRIEKEAEEKEVPSDEGAASADPPSDEAPPEEQEASSGDDRSLSIHDQYARSAGETDYETYWERHFEHNLSDHSYRLAAYEFGAALRELEEDSPRWRAENLVREAYMRRRIEETIAKGFSPNKIVAVVGAFHAPVLNGLFPAMTDTELASLRRRGTKLTLMPYSYFRLSSQSGYGAGNKAPAYFELLYEALEQNDLDGLGTKYLSQVVRHLRDSGTHRSTAEVIEGVRLAKTLSAMKNGLAPTLADLRDAAVTLVGHGELSTIQEALARVDVGTAIGELPKGVSQTSIQEDFEREITRLKLSKHKTAVKQELSLDLRENRQAKTPEAAYLDLHRSAFFHRLRVLEIGFATLQKSTRHSTTWGEKWHVQWTPESEIQLIEAVLLGETVELACAYKFKTSIEACQTIAAAAEMVSDACQCALMKAMEAARRRLQELAAGTTELTAIAHAAHVLGQVVRYGDVRKFDPSPLVPLIEELFVEGSLAMHGAAVCDNAAAKQLIVAMDEMNQVALEFTERVDEPMWLERLERLANADDRNPLLSGYACAILLERGIISNETLAREVSRRLSQGIPADLGAGWFEGLSMRNRYALLARQPLWSQLAEYVSSLDEDHFRRALVFLRRAFGSFNPQEKRHIAENLSHHWGVTEDEASEILEQELNEEEQQKLTDLNEFNFDDL